MLRRDWGYKGYVMSDWGATHSTAPAANAGLDQDSGFPFDKEPYFGAPLKAAVAKGEVSAARLDAMAGAILHAMFANGLFEKPIADAPMDLAPAMLAEHAGVTRRDAEGGAVLLKNRDAILPLSPAVKKIVVIGGHADKGVLAGSGSSLVYPVGGNAAPGSKPTTWPGPMMYYPDAPLAAIKAQAPNAEILFADGGNAGSAAKLARDADVAIVFATQWAGEAFDVSLTLEGGQDKLIAAVARANPRTVVVLETGGPVLTPWRDQAAAILAAWYPGTQGGSAIANLLFGKANPSGRLPVSFPASLDQLAKPAAPNKGDTTYGEGATVGYKWYDAKGLTPAFAFGHGLSYTEFAYSGLRARVEDGTVSASFTVRNTGKVKGKAVPQLYVAGTGWEAPKRLGAFDKVELAPSEAKQVSLKVDPRLLATWDAAGNGWKIAGGTVQVMLGSSAKDIVATVPVTLAPRTIAVGWRP